MALSTGFLEKIVKSTYVVFPEKEKIELWEENVLPPEADEVMCVAEKSLISIGTESFCLRGIFDPGTNWNDWVQYPFRPGYSMAARVVEIGKEVTGIKVGDRISAWVPHQQYFNVKADAVALVPDSICAEDATWTALGCTTQLGIRRAKLKLGESVGVVGLGMLGQLVVQYLALFGARHIIAIDPTESRLELAKLHGATHTLAMEVENAGEKVIDITNGWMLDVVYEITGHPAVLAPSLKLLRKLGRLVLLGDTPTPTEQHLGPGVVSNSLSILGIHGMQSPSQPTEYNRWTALEMAKLFFDYIEQGRMNPAGLVTHRYSPAKAPQVYERLRADRYSSIGIIFDWGLL